MAGRNAEIGGFKVTMIVLKAYIYYRGALFYDAICNDGMLQLASKIDTDYITQVVTVSYDVLYPAKSCFAN